MTMTVNENNFIKHKDSLWFPQYRTIKKDIIIDFVSGDQTWKRRILLRTRPAVRKRYIYK